MSSESWADVVKSDSDSDSIHIESEPTLSNEPEPVAAESEPVVAESEPVAAEPEPVASEPESVAAEPEPVATEPDTTLTNGEYNAKLIVKKDNAWVFEIIINDFIHKVTATFNDTIGYWQLFTVMKGTICTISVKINRENKPIVENIRAVPNIVYKGWIGTINSNNGWLFPLLKKKTKNGIYIPSNINNLFDSNDPNVFDLLNYGMHVLFKIKQNTNRGFEDDYMVDEIGILYVKEGEIIELNHSSKEGKVKYISEGNEKEIKFYKNRLFSRFEQLKLMDKVKFIDDNRDNIIKFVPYDKY